MPLQNEITKNSYIKIDKVYVSSSKRNQNSKGLYQYQVDLDREFTNVVGVEVTGWSFPSKIAPTFVAAGSNFRGTNIVDFALKAGALTTQFSFAWPENQFSYENPSVPYLSYTTVLRQLLYAAIASDADFGPGGAHETNFNIIVDPKETTHFTVSGPGLEGISLLFATGSNQRNSAFNQMGFSQVDTPFQLDTESPGRTRLSPYVYFDISVKQVEEYTPLKRIYVANNAYYNTVKVDPAITRTRLLSHHPIRLLKQLDITITLEGGVIPPVFEGLDHEITFTFFSLQPENSKLPSYLKQVFVM